MADFYENLSRLENEAMRRARHIHEGERRAAARFHEPPPPPEPPRQSGGLMHGLLGGSHLLPGHMNSPDFGLIMLLFLILQSEQSDPLLTLALVYILM